jgi:beta-phosphoglucomutase-like phosphatase (HAD superfamily)
MDQLQLAKHLISRAATVAWDFDGVVADTEPVQAASFDAVLRRHGVSVSGDFFQEFLGKSEYEIWLILRARYEISVTPEEMIAERSGLYLDRAASIGHAHYVSPLLATAAASGAVSVIVSSGSAMHIRYLLDAYGLAESFASLYCLGSPQDLDLPDKSSRLRYVAKHLPSPQVILEDNPEYLALAKTLGMTTIAVWHGMTRLNSREDYDAYLQH